jgi:hypothetical protein
MAENANVGTMTPRFQELESKRALVRDLMGGTARMIEAGRAWLPQHPAESEANYKVRLEQNILKNFLAETVDKAKDKILKGPIIIQENVPAEIQAICENIDRQGRNINSFMQDRLKQAFVDGISFILADTPRAEGVQTRADEKAAGLQPYAVAINADNLLEVMVEVIGGVETITRIRVYETVQIPAGEWGYSTEERIRVLTRESETGVIGCRIFTKQADKDGKDEWVLTEEFPTGLKRIPLVPIYTNRCGFMEGEPPFQATAELNLEHWRSKSEQLHALSFGRFAMLSASGVAEDWKPEVGPSKVLKSTNPDANFAYIESNGTGLDQGWKHLEEITKNIETAQAHLRIQNAGQVTATAAAIDSAETNAGLMAVNQGLIDSIETLFMYFAEMMGLGEDSGGEVDNPFDAGAAKGTDAGLQAITTATAGGIISHNAYIRELIRRGELPEDFDFEQNEQELKDSEPAAPTAEQIAAAMARKKGKAEEGQAAA